MTSDEAKLLISGLEPISPDAPELLGFEPQTHSLDPQTEEGAHDLATVWQEAINAGRKVCVVQEADGGLSIWQATHTFWIKP